MRVPDEHILTVVAALIESDGKLLACQRRHDAAFPLMWEFPGGKLQPGESLAEALVRELREELGIGASVGPEVYRTTHKYAEMQNAVEVVFFACSIQEGTPQNLAFEQRTWCKPSDLPGMNFLAADRELVTLLATGALRVPLF